MEKLEVARSEVKLNWPGLSSNPKRWKELILGSGQMKREHFREHVVCHAWFPIFPHLVVNPPHNPEGWLFPLYRDGVKAQRSAPGPGVPVGGPAGEEPRADVSLSALSCRHMVDLTPLVLNPGGFHFSYLAGNSAHKLHCPGCPW